MKSLVRSFLAAPMLFLALIGIFESGFNVQIGFKEPRTFATEPQILGSKSGLGDRWSVFYGEDDYMNAARKLEWDDFNWGCGESARLVVGVGASRLQMNILEDFIAGKGVTIIDSISTGENIWALTVEVSSSRVFQLIQELHKSEFVRYVEPDFIVNASFVPNDPYWSSQWGPNKIEADWAWNTTIGSSDILVAIVDTGIDYTHEDLAANYVPLGYDWVNNDNDPIDDNGHGTHCAGIVAAKLNNGVGIAGLAQVRIMAEKVLGRDGQGYDTWVAQGIIHATDQGAKVISMSLGGPEYSQLMHEAVKYAHDHGVVVVASAGNTATKAPHYPAAYEEVIAVSATDPGDKLAGFSTFGEWIDLSAPGVNIYSAVPINSYKYLSGTSMACPHVSGVAALAWSVYPKCTADQIRWILENTADDLGYKGFDQLYGHGRVNARKAVSLPDHDLCIVECKYRYRIDPEQRCEFNVTIGNYGKCNETNILIRFYINEILINFTTISLLRCFSSTTVVFSWSTMLTGNYNVKFYVVPVSGESSIQNNYGFYEVAVRFPTTLRVRYDYPTIKAAIDHAGDGDVILVSKGYYDEGQIDILKDNITLVSDDYAFINGSRAYCAINVVANYVSIEGFDIRNSPAYGVSICGHGNVLTRNNIVGNRDSLRLYDSSGCTISLNYFENHSGGIYVENCVNNTITKNLLIGGSSDGGIHVISSSNNTISFNTITGGIVGCALEIYLSNNNLIVSNTITANRFGLALIGSPNNILRNNTLANNWCNFSPRRSEFRSALWNGPSDVDASNTVDGKPICYWVNVSNKVVPSNVSCVVLVNCKNIVVENLELRGNFYGIFLANSSNILIRRNNITQNFANFHFMSCGIYGLSDCFNITITENNITRNDGGIILFGCNNTISFNNIADNFYDAIRLYNGGNVIRNNITGQQGYGVCLGGTGCIVSSNNIMSNLAPNIVVYGSYHNITLNNIIGSGSPDENIFITDRVGISLHSANCTITLNNFIELGEYAVTAQNAANNTIVHNNFINNPKEFRNFDGSINTWDAGYPFGGNYWSDYNGTDDDGDGIGDTPYVLDANNTDRYPLMNPVAANPPPKTCSLRIKGWIGNTPIKGFYDTPYPRPGKYIFMANSTIYIGMHLHYNTFVDHWELDDINIGSGESVNVFMDANHTLEVFLSNVPPLTVSIEPVNSTIRLGESVNFISMQSGGRPPYFYQWCVNGITVLDATSPTWNFTPQKTGIYNVTLIVRYPFSLGYMTTPAKSNVAFVKVVFHADVNGDGVVDMRDIGILCNNFMMTPDDPEWNPNYDINRDGIVNMRDIGIACNNFMKKI